MRHALWITRFDWEDEADLTALVTRAIKVGVTDVLMQARGAGDALYRSEVAPASAKIAGRLGWAPKWDPLEVVCELAARHDGVRVHAWVNALSGWPSASIEVCAGDALYRSEVAPASAKIAGRLGWAPKWDPLEVVCELAARHDGVRVHAWVNALSGWPSASIEVCAGPEPSRPGFPDHLLVRHPDAVLVDASGRPMPCPNDTDYVWISARHVEVVRELEAVTSELVSRYPLAGIHLDRIRYPTAGWFDPIDGERSAQGITDLVAAVRGRAPGSLHVSASLMPDYGSAPGGEPDHIATYGQDGWAWVKQELCTDVMPMVYTTIQPGEPWDWATLTAQHLDALPDGTCWVALYAEHEPEMLREQAAMFADQPIAGIAWYSARLVRENDRWDVLRDVVAGLG